MHRDRPPQPPGSSRRGFTIIEMLVVMGIIILLAAITFPVVASVRSHGKRTGCMENMRQIIQALKLYKDDWGVYPDALYGYDDYSNVNQANPQPVERRFLFPQYIRSRRDFTCPASVWSAPAREADASQGIPPEGDDLCLSKAIFQNWQTGQPAVTPYYYYPWSTYDAYMVPNGREGVTCGSPSQPFATYNSGARFVELHYQRFWLDSNPIDPRQVGLRSPSEQTVVTWCLNHAREQVTDGSSRQVVLDEGALALVAFLDGHVESRPATQMVIWDNAEGHTWKISAKP
jgi:prepilin-type N-terminal cleavage/methylation domain-containing protein